MSDTPKAAQKSWEIRVGAGSGRGRTRPGDGWVVLKVAPDKVNTPRLLGR